MAKLRKQKHRRKAQPRDLAARSAHPKLKAHHTKPYRRRHILLLIAALAYMFLLVFQLGLIVGGSRQQPEDAAPPTSIRPELSTISSSFGFSFAYDGNAFAGSANAIDDAGVGSAVGQADLAADKPINFAQIKPRAGAVRSNLAASQFSVQVQTDKQALAKSKQDPANKDKTSGQLAAQVLPLGSTAGFEVSQISQADEIIGDGAQVLRTTYQFTPKFEGGLSYATTWHGVIDDRAFVIKLTGLVASSTVPAEYGEVIDSFKLSGTPKVQGLSFSGIETAYAAESGLDAKYVADLASPSVVKIYHIMCGDLVIGSQKYEDACDGGTGSGAILSQDGYIATNGHVVVITAKDMFVREVTSSRDTFIAFLRGLGYTDTQIAEIVSNPQKLAAFVAKIYDLPDTDIFLDQPKEITLVALGEQPLMLQQDTKLEDLFATQDSDDIKVAKVVGTNYNSKDLWVAQSGDPTGFSSSDVALLKVDVNAAPSLTISTAPITQNEKIVVLGFPGDAENQLVDNSSLDVSVTNGSISAIKDAAGGKGKLYQSDADASHGNSGGPAITQDGEVFGLLTYRVSGDDQGNAAKSYIRDVADLSELAKEKSATLGGPSPTLDNWRRGLTLYSQNHFSAAKKEFQKVENAYGSHRLVNDYIDNATKQIAAGNDVPLYSPLLIGGAIIVGLVAVGGAIVLIVRHRAKHQAYLSGKMPSQPAPAGPQPAGSPATPTQPAVAALTPTPQPMSMPPAVQQGSVVSPTLSQPSPVSQPPAIVQPIQPTPTIVQPQQTIPPSMSAPQPQVGRPIDQIMPAGSQTASVGQPPSLPNGPLTQN